MFLYVGHYVGFERGMSVRVCIKGSQCVPCCSRGVKVTPAGVTYYEGFLMVLLRVLRSLDRFDRCKRFV